MICINDQCPYKTQETGPIECIAAQNGCKYYLPALHKVDDRAGQGGSPKCCSRCGNPIEAEWGVPVRFRVGGAV